MSIVFKPLTEQAEKLSTFAKPYQQVYDQIADQITFTDLSPCPLCHDDQLVEYIQPHNNPEHGEYSVAISCRQCRIQTQPQYWFISEPTSATRALNAVIQNWQQLTSPLPAGEGQGEGDLKTGQTDSSAANKAERRDKFNLADHAISFEQMAKLDTTGEETEVTVEYGDNGESINGVIIPHEQWQAIKQDAARYQYIKQKASSDDPKISCDLGMLQMKFPLAKDFLYAKDADGRVRVDLEGTIDNAIDASIKQQAANP